ncbi:hypothetical protein COLO4_13780 [Corchorus olitorius]|uniref:Uncharacterized protein n=1 Tax=Corchorus olitorius TaxID=93759 RepID=A0A1R3JV82_9ROSI|nr:hypothetical protein COLO4_13780 [Corchorus olitorius]
MDELKKKRPSAHEDLMKVAPEHHRWCRAFFQEESCYEIVDNNLTEALNGSLFRARRLSVVSLFEEIRRKLMERIAAKLEECSKWKGNLGKRIWNVIEKNSMIANYCEVMFNGRGGYEIQHGEDRVPGRPTTQRRKKPDEPTKDDTHLSRKSQIQTCSAFKQQGHNKRSKNCPKKGLEKKAKPLPKILTMPPRTGEFNVLDEAGNFHGVKRGRSSPTSIAKLMKKAPTVAENRIGDASQFSKVPVRRSPRNLTKTNVANSKKLKGKKKLF